MHGFPHVCCVVEGGFDERTPNGVRRCLGGTIRLSQAEDSHTLDFGEQGANCLILTMDGGTARELDAYPLERRYVQAAFLHALAGSIYGWLSMERVDPLALECRGWELLAQTTRRLRRRSGGLPP